MELKNIKPKIVGHSYAVEQYSALASDNDYMPLASYYYSQLNKKETKKEVFYQLVMSNLGLINTIQRKSKLLKLFVNNNKSRLSIIAQKSTNIDNNYTYSCNYGVLTAIDIDGYVHILALLAIKNRCLHIINKDNIDPKHLCILIDNKFKQRHRNLFRIFNAMFIKTRFNTKDMDIVFTDSIADRCFSTGSSLEKKYVNIIEMVEYLNKGLSDKVRDLEKRNNSYIPPRTEIYFEDTLVGYINDSQQNVIEQVQPIVEAHSQTLVNISNLMEQENRERELNMMSAGQIRNGHAIVYPYTMEESTPFPTLNSITPPIPSSDTLTPTQILDDLPF